MIGTRTEITDADGEPVCTAYARRSCTEAVTR